jgi:hypothetical protein
MGAVSVWAHDNELGEALCEYLVEPGRAVHVLRDDAELAAHSASGGGLLVAQAGPRLTAQQAFVREPFILIDPQCESPATLARRAYAVVDTVAEAGLFVDRYFVHRDLAQRAASRRDAPRRCSRCGRGFDPQRARAGGSARRFVRFGSVALCGGCVEKLRALLRQAESPVIEADA